MSSNEKKKEKGKYRIFDKTGRRLMKEMRPLRGWILLAAVFCLLLIGCAAALPELMGKMIDRLYDWSKNRTPGLAKSLLPGLGILLGLYALKSGLNYGKYYMLQTVVSRYFCADLRIRISEKLSRLPVSYMDKTPAGDIIDRMTDDVSEMSSSIYWIADILLSGFLQMIVIAVILFLTDWRLAIPVVLLSPLSVLLSSKLAGQGDEHWSNHFELGGKLTSLAEEAFTNYPATKAFNAEKTMQKKYEKLSWEHQKSGVLGYFMSSIVQPVIAFVTALAYIAVAVVGG
ncbi:MAG: hypothetical protein J6128_06490, partial [Clostridia bacterium]|nr:hypothetical protein [Clostridia bacterium]